MRNRIATLAIALTALIALATAPRAAGPSQPADNHATTAPALDPALHEEVTRLPVSFTQHDGEAIAGDMVLTTARPSGDGPFPAVVISHGRDPKKREETRRFNYPALVRYWTKRGFAVFIPTRLGYGDSGTGIDPESAKGCDRADYDSPITAITHQIAATVAYARTRSWVDPERILLMGQSYGGFGTMMAGAQHIAGVKGVINFAGGLGGAPATRPGTPCAAEKIEKIVADAGAKSTLPEIWFYASNDHYWGLIWPQRWHAAFQARGGRAMLVLAPPVGEEGHYLMAQGFEHWRPRLDGFLVSLGFTVPHATDAPPPSGFAALADLAAVPFISPSARTDGYRKFLAADVPRAFAVSPTGAWAWASGTDVTKKALDTCRTNAHSPTCKLYAVDDAVVWPKPAAGDTSHRGVSPGATGTTAPTP